MQAIYRALAASAAPPHEIAFVSGIGCSSRIPGYTTAYGFNTVHGRALPIAQGIKLANPELLVLVAGGDGDGFSIGGGHVAHAIRRNVDLTYIVMDNQIYGLTKGQLSPTSPRGLKTASSTWGSLEDPVNPLLYVLGYGAGFVAQGTPADMAGARRGDRGGASAFPGFAFVNVQSPCVTYGQEEQQLKAQKAQLQPSASLGHDPRRPAEGDGARLGVRHEALHRRLLPQPRAASDLRGRGAAAAAGRGAPAPGRRNASSRCSCRSIARRRRAPGAYDRPPPDRAGRHGRPRLHAAGRGRGTIEDHERNAAAIAALLMTLVERDYYLCITHGNGPQVGNLLLQQERCSEVPALPLDVLVAMTEGSLGYILQQALLNELRKRQMKRYVVTVVTQVVVDENDPAFHDRQQADRAFPRPRQEAERRRDALGWKVKEDAGRGWRRLVPSPSAAARDPAPHDPRRRAPGPHRGRLRRRRDPGQEARPTASSPGVEAVIDKDLTSSVLAADLGAALLVILTAVPQVYVDFGQPSQHALGAVTLEEIERLHAEGHFPPGSMGPKIEAVIRFLKAGGRRALITNPETLPHAIEGRGGTHFVGGI